MARGARKLMGALLVASYDVWGVQKGFYNEVPKKKVTENIRI